MDADLDAVIAALKAKRAEQTCPVCAAYAEFEVNFPDSATVFLTVHDPDGGASALPVLPLICRSCGYVRLHSPAHLLGVDESSKDP